MGKRATAPPEAPPEEPEAPEDEWGDPLDTALKTNPLWDFPSMGDLVGDLTSIRRQTVRTGPSAGKEKSIYDFETAIGEYSIWGQAMLDRVLPVHVGHYVRIRPTGGKIPVGKGEMSEYLVWCRHCQRAGQ